MHILDPKDLMGRSFLIPQEDSQRLRDIIVKAIDDHDGMLHRDPTILKYIFSEKYDTVQNLFTYN